MRLDELDYLESISPQNALFGSGYTYASATTYAGQGFGYATAAGLALGDSTVTATKTTVTIRLITPYTDFTSASAKASAISTDSTGYSSSRVSSKSLYVGTTI